MAEDIFKALADSTRRQILQLLLEEGDKSAGEIVERFSVSGATISHHLSVLKAADLVSTKRQGKAIIYSANTTVFENMISKFYKYFGGDKKDA